ncbi:MAG: hypothetical protein HN916_18550, partial [Anaerolineae bacterium]|nr:hypothetical protein [Anaerolineae bacterium]
RRCGSEVRVESHQVQKVDGELLRAIALATDGVYVPAGTAALDLESIVDAHVKPIVRNTETVSRAVAVERYHWFIAASLVSLCAAIRIGSRWVLEKDTFNSIDDLLAIVSEETKDITV